MNNDLMQKLMMSKAIMDKVNEKDRNGEKPTQRNNNIQLEEFDSPNVKYNIPQEFLSEEPQRPTTDTSHLRGNKEMSVDAIKNSKLPDEIKRLMIEHPIQKQQTQQPVLSDELIEKASRLMRKEDNNYLPESAKPKSKPQQSAGQIDYSVLKKIVKEVVEESLKENGLLIESSEKSNELFSFKVGKHIFEGRVTKIKKVS